MTAINAISPGLEPAAAGAESTDELLRRLCTPIPARNWGAVFAGVVTYFTFGLLPLFFWPRRWSAFCEIERQDMLSLSAWWLPKANPRDARRLVQATDRLDSQSLYTIVPLLIVVFISVMIAGLFFFGDSFEDLGRLTYYFRPLFTQWQVTHLSPLELNFHSVWMAGLLIAYGCQWVAVRSRFKSVLAITKAINHVSHSTGGTTVRVPGSANGLNPVWVIAAICLCAAHVWWGIPFALAGAMQRRYMVTTAPTFRRVLANQLKDFAKAGQPKPFSGTRKFCQGLQCAAMMPAVARYCPRCGMAAPVA